MNTKINEVVLTIKDTQYFSVKVLFDGEMNVKKWELLNSSNCTDQQKTLINQVIDDFVEMVMINW